MPSSADPQLGRVSAELYNRILVPAILGPFAQALVDWSALRPGDWILDIGCGTGAAARAAAENTGAFGRVVGLDSDTEMLEHARSLPLAKGKTVEWQEGDIYKMPLPSKIFDVVFAAQTVQHLADKAAALSEVRRVLRPGGRFILSVWSQRTDSPLFDSVFTAVRDHLNADSAELLQPAFMLADRSKFETLLRDAGFHNMVITLNRLDQTFPNLDQFIPEYLSATPAGNNFRAASAQVQQAVVSQVKAQLAGALAAGAGWLPFQAYFAQAYN